MKQLSALFRLTVLGCLFLPAAAPAADEKISGDKAKQLLEKGLGELSKAAGKVDGKDKDKDSSKGDGVWERSKETLKLSRDEYLKKVQSAFATVEAEIQVLTEGGSNVTTRDYFKARIDALKLHLEFCKRDCDRLKENATEEAFRVKQRGFDRTLGFLSDNLEIAKDESGL